jgi:hypothetical protein
LAIFVERRPSKELAPELKLFRLDEICTGATKTKGPRDKGQAVGGRQKIDEGTKRR